MSGIETAGLVLAVLPLIVNQLDNYVQGLQTISSFRTRKYRSEFESYLTTLETQQVAFLDTLEHALEDVVDHEEEVSELIDNPQSLLWCSEKFQAKLRKKLGRGYSPFVKTIKELAGLLECISNKLGLDPSKQDIVWSDERSLKQEIKKFKTVVSKSIYNDLLRKISDANSRLKTLVEQSEHREEVRKKRRVSKKPFLKHKSGRKVAKSLHNALVRGKCWQCPCKDHHRIHFHINTDIVVAGNPTERPKFRLTFTSKSAPGVPCRWHEVETEPVIISSPARQPKSPIPEIPKVRFALAESVQPVLDSIPCPGVQNNTPSPISDLCSTLCSLQTDQRRELIGSITDEIDRSHRHDLYLMGSLHQLETKSLEELVASSSPLGPGFTLGASDCCYLAAVLACSVLQFQGTWLKSQWRTRDILFLKDEAEGKALFDHPYLSSQLLTQDATTRSQKESALIQSEILFPLGLALVELSLCRTLSVLRSPEDDDPVEAVANLKTASRYLYDVGIKSGSVYLDVVKKCLFWPGPSDRELDDEDFHATVFDAIVAPLIDHLRTFRGQTPIFLNPSN